MKFGGGAIGISLALLWLSGGGSCGGEERPERLAVGQAVVREWDQGKNPVRSVRGRQALQIRPTSWCHLESDSFVLHSAHKGVALRTAQEAEFYLRQIREALGLDEQEGPRRTHIFIFENEADWNEFKQTATVDPWTGGFFDGLDLFLWQRSGIGVYHAGATLPHEIAHRVLYEKYPQASLPLALHEGFAEYQARRLAFRYLRPRGYDVRVISKRVSPGKFLPAQTLLSRDRYEDNPARLEAFYDLSERLVHLLLEQHGLARFRELLTALAAGERFPVALVKVYAGIYKSVDQFERAFRDYAVDEKLP